MVELYPSLFRTLLPSPSTQPGPDGRLLQILETTQIGMQRSSSGCKNNERLFSSSSTAHSGIITYQTVSVGLPVPCVPAIAVHTAIDTWNRVSRLSNTHPGRGQGQPTRQCSTVNQLSHFTLTSPPTGQSACTTRFTCRNAKCAFITFFPPYLLLLSGFRQTPCVKRGKLTRAERE